MAEWSGPFDSTTDLTEARWRKLMRYPSGDGVLASYGGTALAVTASGDGLSVNVAAGDARIQSGLYESTATVNKTNSSNGGGSGRPDRVVLRYDPTANSIALVVREGTVGGTTPPALVQSDSGQWDVPLARWIRAAGGGIGSVIDERTYLDRTGAVTVGDAAIASPVGIGGIFPNPWYGMRCFALPSGQEYRYIGFWERIDPAPLLYTTNNTSGTTASTSFTSTLTGSSDLAGSFVAPASGSVRVTAGARITPGTTSSNVGSKDGSVTIHISGPGGFSNVPSSPDDDRVMTIYDALSSADRSWIVVGMTPGSVYTATMKHQVTAAVSCAFDNRSILIERA
jgi:hypothetical protein